MYIILNNRHLPSERIGAIGTNFMASLSSNLKTLMTSVHINASELARRTGIAQPIIHRLSTGQNTNPKLATIKPIARYFMVNISQLIGEEPLPSDQSPQITGNYRAWNRVPLISWKDATSWPEALPHYQTSDEVMYISTDANVSKLAYGLIIQGCAMEPLFPNGTTIIVEPERKPKDRDFVVVRLQGEPEARLRQIITEGNDRYLKSLNPELEKLEVARLAQEDQFLGVMAQAKVDFLR
ncbi:S24 family peptidase [Coxiella burnetii]|nr:S24 family peptidase [Coxiella burnetii]ATN74809.1 transcriptional regulator [Coxiella burnetii]ATN76713.1 transcriptional regulator [Coxiella burnetii]ATN78631.1 transcriptional regulator [Coxiella burnetii]ATN80540.1 transcriptional regulator [Coxiella burnetii]OYK90430.1 transcriptional regulator [Coxiella burnetii]